MQADHRGRAQQLVQLDEPDPVGPGGRRVGVRVGDEDRRTERVQHAGDDAADGAVADQPDGGPVELQPGLLVGVEVAAPAPGVQLGVRERDAAQRGERHAHRELGGGRGVAPGRLGDGDPGAVRGVEVDVDRAAPAHRDHLQLRPGVEHPRGERGHLRQADAGPVERVDELVLGARGLLDHRVPGADRTEGVGGPAGGEVGDVEGGQAGLAAQGGLEQGRRDEVVAGGQHAGLGGIASSRVHGGHLSWGWWSCSNAAMWAIFSALGEAGSNS